MKLRIEKAIYGGAGLARIGIDEQPGSMEEQALAGKTVFVPYALPGELVEARITEDRRSFSNAEIASLLEPSPERTLPGCMYFPACGGCHYQHANAPYQLQMKLDVLRDVLDRAHLNSPIAAKHFTSSPINPHGEIEGLRAEPWGYRNRIRLHLVPQPDGLALCYRARGSHKNLAVTHCPIAAPLLNRAITAVLDAGRETKLGGVCDEIELFTNAEESELLLSLWSSRAFDQSSRRSAQEILPAFSTRLKSRLPELVGAGLLSRGERQEKLLDHWARTSLTYTVFERRYQVGLGSFFQVNRFLTPQLLKLVVGDSRGRMAWDLYAGVGLFACALNFDQVTAVEESSFSSADLKYNLAPTPHRAVRSTTLEFLRTQLRLKPGPKPDLILLDPPRAGLGKDICSHLAAIAAPTIVYVSCDPATLARDLQQLLRSGYRLKRLSLVDLFPQTFHLETVAVLEQG